MWTNWPQAVQDESMAAGGVDKDSLGRRTMRGLVLQRARGQAMKGPIGRGGRGEDGKSGASWGKAEGKGREGRRGEGYKRDGIIGNIMRYGW